MGGMDRRRVAAVVRRNAYVQMRSPHRWFDVLVWPVVDTVIWGSIGRFVDLQAGPTRSGAAYLLSGILLMHVLYQSNIAVSTGFLEETWSRNLLNLMVTPLREAEFLAGLVLASLARLALGMVMVTLAAWSLYAFDVTEVGLGLVPVVGVLMGVGWCIAMIVIALVLRFGHGAEILAWGLLFIVVALSGAFYPLDALPGPLQPVATVLPSSHAFEAARTLLDGEPLPWGRIAVSMAGLAVLVPAVWVFSLRMLRTFRRRRLLTRYS